MEDNANCKANRRSWARGRACLPLFAAAAAAVVRIEALLSPDSQNAAKRVQVAFCLKCTIEEALPLTFYVGYGNRGVGFF